MSLSSAIRTAASFLTVLSAVSGVPSAFADYTADPHLTTRDLYQGARAMAMGNAFVSVADDDEAIFYNPAGLAGIDSTTLNFVNTDLEVSGDIVTSATQSVSQFNNIGPSTADILMGKDFYLRGNYSPTFTSPNFGGAILMDQQLSLVSQNKALPQVELGYQTTNGVQLAYGYSLGRTKKSRSEWRIGGAVKILSRRGGYYLLTQQQELNLGKSELKSLIGNFGTGFGFDLGTQYIYRLTSTIKVQAGAAWTEVGGMKFSTDTAEPINGDLSMGLSVHYDFSRLGAMLSYDMRHINSSMDYRLRNHFGAEVSVPLFQLYTGLNGVYPSFGIGMDLGLFKLMLVSYAQELGYIAYTNTERRYLLHISLGL